VLDADRFGVSQLHQLRGRVGRGTAPGLCLLVTEAPPASPARERLDAVAATLDGFRLAELDLEQRREGDVLGAAQSGRRSHLRLLSLLRDTELIREARAAAIELIDADPELATYHELAEAVAGPVGLEQASRGAAHVLLVEAAPKAARVIRENVVALAAGATCRLAAGRVEAVVAAAPDAPFDVVFADPPYAVGDDELAGVLAGLVN